MKRLLLIVFSCNLFIVSLAHDFSAQIGNYTYFFNYVSRANKTVELTQELISSTSSSASYRIGLFSGAVDVPSYVDYDGVTYTIVAIGKAYYGCKKITSITLPETITEIKDDAFTSCTALKTINWNTSIEKIGARAFYQCYGLEVIDMPNSVTELGERVFYACSSLRDVRLSNSISTCSPRIFANCTSLQNVYNVPSPLPEAFFSNCASLESVFLPSNITSIPQRFFEGCTQLNTIYYEGTREQWNNVLINDTGNDVLQDVALIFNKEQIDNASTFKNNGITYIITSIINKEVKIINWRENHTEIFIPTSVFYKDISFNVVGISDEALEGELYLNRIFYGGSAEEWNLMNISEYGRTVLSNVLKSYNYDIVANPLNKLYFDSPYVSANSIDSVSLYLRNSMPVTGFQFELELPEGITIPESTMPYISNERTTTLQHNIFDVRRLTNGRYLFICSSLSNSTFSGNDGEVAIIPLQIAESVQDGNYVCILHNVAITDANAYVERIAEAQYILSVKTINTYRLSYMVDGIEYAHDSIDNDSPVTMRPEPTREGYTFSGWDKILTIMPNHDDTIRGSFSINSYTITFLNYNNSRLQRSAFEYGTMPTYNGATPTKPSTTQYSFVFSGWTPELVPVSANATYRAKFDTIVNQYTITFQNYDGTILQNSLFDHGSVPVYEGATPTKPSTTQYSYSFSGWSPKIISVTGNASYTAQFDSVLNEYTVTFMNGDGTILGSEKWEYGSEPLCKETPTKPATEQYSYIFAGWSPAVTTVTENATYVATFDSVVNQYPIHFLNYNGDKLQAFSFEYGQIPECWLTFPYKPETEQYEYVFTGWYPEITPVVGEAVYVAQFDSIIRKYTINFVNYNNTNLQSTRNEYGTMPEYMGETPTRPSKNGYRYDFIGWSPEIAVVTDDATYTATFERVLNQYAITFQNYDGTILQNSLFDHGSVPVYDGVTPTKQSTAQYSYNFAGWSPNVTAAVGEAVYTAVFDSVVNTYTITFQNYDGTVLQSTEFEYGSFPSYEGMTPTKPSTAQYSYSFAGWSPDVTAAVGEAVYTAVYDSVVNTYMVTFVNNGVTLQSAELEYGSIPSYTGAIPTKPSTVQYSYSFAGWSPNVTAAVGEAVYTAVFDSVVNTYTITFQNYDGAVLQSTEVEYGSVPTYVGATPQKEATEQYSYTFAGWNPEVVAVTGNATYKATYTATKNSYTITWLNEDGSIIDQTTVQYGKVPTHAVVTKQNTAEYTYTFAGWTPSISIVTGDATYRATYTATKNSYTITWQNENGSLIDQTIVEYGIVPTHEDPVKASTSKYTYTFSGWSPEVVPVIGDATYRATFTATKKSYTITWLNEDGSMIDQTVVEYGDVPTHSDPVKTNTAEYTYTFAGWTPNIVSVKADATYRATFNATKNKYLIIFRNDDGTELQSSEVEYGTLPIAPTNPTKESTAQYNYMFNGWTPNVVVVTQAATYTATYTSSLRSYIVSFVNDDNSIISMQSYKYGEFPVLPDTPTKAATAEYTYTFAGWTPAISIVIADATYKATYNATKNSYTITWLNEDGSMIDQTTVEFGVLPTHADPVKANTAEYTYTFAGWTPNVVAVLGDATYRATFSSTLNMYIISATAINGEVEGVGEYAYGAEIELEAIPAEGYVFDQWSDGITDNPRTIVVSGDAEYTAIFIQSQGVEAVYISDPVQKVIIDDKIYILRGEHMYTVQGQEVK